MVAALYAGGMAILGINCNTFWSRLDNRLAFAITAACVLAMGIPAVRGGPARAWAGFAAGILTGLYFQPSTAVVVAIAALFGGTRNALSSATPKLALLLLAAGVAVGFAALLGLMTLAVPANIRC